MKPFKARPLIGDIAAQRLWGKGAAPQHAVDVLGGTFAQQRAFIEDPAKLKWALCTRRAAKSYSCRGVRRRGTAEWPGTCGFGR